MNLRNNLFSLSVKWTWASGFNNIYLSNISYLDNYSLISRWEWGPQFETCPGISPDSSDQKPRVSCYQSWHVSQSTCLEDHHYTCVWYMSAPIQDVLSNSALETCKLLSVKTFSFHLKNWIIINLESCKTINSNIKIKLFFGHWITSRHHFFYCVWQIWGGI